MGAMRWPFRPWKPTEPTDLRPTQDATRAARGAAASDADQVSRIAQEHLSGPVLERWLTLLRPAIRLVPAAAEEQCVARLGGLPLMPAETGWPTWPGHGPLSYIGEIHCDRATGFPLDISIPASGRILFFYFDGSYDNFAAPVGTWDVATLQGARAIHVPGDAVCARRTTPGGVTTYPERGFAGRTIVTAPGWEHPDLRAAFKTPGQDDRSFLDHPVTAEAFTVALAERDTGPLHQVGGYAAPVQGPVEHEVAQAALDNQVPYGDPRLDEEARRWELLLQVDSDDALGMSWGDAGVLYWMTRVEDRAPGDAMSDVSFTWQCG